MARADRALQRVVRPLAAKSVLHAFLKGSLVITFLLGIIGAFGPVPLKNAGNGFLTGLKSAVLIDSSHDGLEDVTEIGIPCSAALGLLAASKEKKARSRSSTFLKWYPSFVSSSFSFFLSTVG